MKRFLLLAVMASACSSSQPDVPSVDAATVSLAIVNARVWTGDRERPWAEAVAIADHRIAAVGTTEEVRRFAHGRAAQKVGQTPLGK